MCVCVMRDTTAVKTATHVDENKGKNPMIMIDTFI